MEPSKDAGILPCKGTDEAQIGNDPPRNETPSPVSPKYRGVTKKNNTWAANLWFQGKQVYLGTYPNPSTAARMYDYAAHCLLSSSSMRLNFPEDPISESPHSTARNAVAKVTTSERPPSPLTPPGGPRTEIPGTPQKQSGPSAAVKNSPSSPKRTEVVGSRRSSCSTEEAEALSGLMSLVNDNAEEQGSEESISRGGEKWSKPAMLSIPPVETPKLVSSPTPAKQPKKRKAGSEMKEGTVRNKTQNSTPKAKPSMPNNILVDSPTGGTKSSRSKSGFFGVSADRSRKKWVATIHIKGGKAVNLGTFSTREEAAMAFDAEAYAQRGASANLNFPERWTTSLEQQTVASASSKLSVRQSTPARDPDTPASKESRWSNPAKSQSVSQAQPTPMKAPETPTLSESSAIVTPSASLSRNDSLECPSSSSPTKQHFHSKKKRLLEALVLA